LAGAHRCGGAVHRLGLLQPSALADLRGRDAEEVRNFVTVAIGVKVNSRLAVWFS
jgi:hypothetical protein